MEHDPSQTTAIFAFKHAGGIKWVSDMEHNFVFAGDPVTSDPLLVPGYTLESGVENPRDVVVNQNVSGISVYSEEGLVDDYEVISWYGHEVLMYFGRVMDGAAHIVANNHIRTFINLGISSTNVNSIEFEIAPLTWFLNTNVQDAYLSTAANDADVQTPVPLVFGGALSVPGKLISFTEIDNHPAVIRQRYVWQVHEGDNTNPFRSIDAVYYSGKIGFTGVGPDSYTPSFRYLYEGLHTKIVPGTGLVQISSLRIKFNDYNLVFMKHSNQSGTPAVQLQWYAFSHGYGGHLIEEEFPVTTGWLVIAMPTASPLPSDADTYTTGSGGTLRTGTVVGNAFVNNVYYETSDVLANEVRCNVNGQSNHPTRNRLEDIVYPMLYRKLLNANVNQTEINQASDEMPHNLGLYIDQEKSILDSVASLLTTGVMTGFIDGPIPKFTIRTLKDPSTITVADHEIEGEEIDYAGFNLVETQPPVWRVTVKCDRNQSPISQRFEGEVTSDITDAVARTFSVKYRTPRSVYDTAVKNASPIPSTMVIESAILDAGTIAGALEAQRIHNLFKVFRRLYVVPVYDRNFEFVFGDSVNIKHSRHGFSLGKKAIILKPIDVPSENRTDLLVWL